MTEGRREGQPMSTDELIVAANEIVDKATDILNSLLDIRDANREDGEHDAGG